MHTNLFSDHNFSLFHFLVIWNIWFIFYRIIALICDSLWVPGYLSIHPHPISILGLFQFSHFFFFFCHFWNLSCPLSLTSFHFLILTWENSNTQSVFALTGSTEWYSTHSHAHIKIKVFSWTFSPSDSPVTQ